MATQRRTAVATTAAFIEEVEPEPTPEPEAPDNTELEPDEEPDVTSGQVDGDESKPEPTPEQEIPPVLPSGAMCGACGAGVSTAMIMSLCVLGFGRFRRRWKD